MSVDLKSTVFLPRTDFPMRGGLPDLEPKLLDRWEKLGLFQKLRDVRKGAEPFVLHDGPPYANGNLHIGHALNKILKDIINRTQQMLGKNAYYVPGWDCHGLPIEWKIEEQYRAGGRDKDAVPIAEFRRECREFALHWIDVQREEFKRLGVVGDWDNPYTTMAYDAEAAIVGEIHKFLMNGSLYRGAKPVMWSVVEKTALAEAEIEYEEHTSKTVYIAFPVLRSNDPALAGASIVIWTTTPWTLPANRAIAYGPQMVYRVYEVAEIDEGSRAQLGQKIVLAEALAEETFRHAKIKAAHIVGAVVDLGGAVCAHPLRAGGFTFEVPVLAGDFVTAETGTGFVHIAPSHGEDDWKLGIAHGIKVEETVLADGTYPAWMPLFAGKRVYTPDGKEGDANEAVIAAMVEAGALLARGKLTHSYPHSWRSKAPLIFRTTPQWFIALDDDNHIRSTALQAIDDTRWVPAQGRNRIYAMVEQRPDWCVSRQRAWGVPIALFVNKKTGELLRDPDVNARITNAFMEEGADAWFVSPPSRFLGNGRDPDEWEQIADILDVWFDSGSTHAFVLESGKWGLPWPASLYLEGSDQHRGWFHSSLLEACGTRGRAPYNEVLTHGFVLDEQGRKMSKSLGNVVAPQEVVSASGADILRLWVTSSDYSGDLSIGPTVLKTQIDIYRRLRNTLRYLLGALDGFTEAERVAPADMPPLERWVLHRLHGIDAALHAACHDYEFHPFFAELHQFCAVDLSAFYFDVRKDALYCDDSSSARRRAARSAMDLVFEHLVRWLAPFLCFTAEEAYLARHPGEQESVHLQSFPVVPADWRNDALAARFDRVREARRVVTGALEIERVAKRIGSGLQADPELYVDAALAGELAGLDMAEIAITSSLTIKTEPPPDGVFVMEDVPGVGVRFRPAQGDKCQRCWRVLPEVTHNLAHLCERCAPVVAKLEAAE